MPNDGDDNVALHGGFTPVNRSIEACSLIGLQRTYFVLDIHVN